MTPKYCRHCGQPMVPGTSFCGVCGHAVEPAQQARPAAPTVPARPAAPAPVAPLPPAPAPGPYAAAPPPRQPGGRRVGLALLVGVLAVVVMLGVGTGTAYLLTRDDGSSDTASSSSDDHEEAEGPQPSVRADDPTATVTVTQGATTEAGEDLPAGDPELSLRDIVAADEARADQLVGSWVPQLASISGEINGSWSSALAEYEELKGFFPDLVLVDAGDWPHAFVPSDSFDVVFVVLSPTPASPTSAPVLEWCQLNRGDRQASCYAKLIERTGSPRDNTDQNEPEPEFN